mmetsp:Transcript_58598/g.137986  ORF Transcript_58598/g.137986 Transcript_58598/m.137986 type:complete len:153 (+) Transcript_58598:1307-1765(+)
MGSDGAGSGEADAAGCSADDLELMGSRVGRSDTEGKRGGASRMTSGAMPCPRAGSCDVEGVERAIMHRGGTENDSKGAAGAGEKAAGDDDDAWGARESGDEGEGADDRHWRQTGAASCNIEGAEGASWDAEEPRAQRRSTTTAGEPACGGGL